MVISEFDVGYPYKINREPECCCSANKDGTVTSFICPVDAGQDPCVTFAQITGKRRKGTIRSGVCTNCGWTETI